MPEFAVHEGVGTFVQDGAQQSCAQHAGAVQRQQAGQQEQCSRRGAQPQARFTPHPVTPVPGHSAALCAKFQNSELKSKLKATGDAVLAEGAVRDCIWGIGLSMTDPKRLEMEKWRGQNLLGFALMMVRDGI